MISAYLGQSFSSSFAYEWELVVEDKEGIKTKKTLETWYDYITLNGKRIPCENGIFEVVKQFIKKTFSK